MGANKSMRTVIDPTSHAELVDQTKQCSVYRNKNGQEFQKYRVQNYGTPEFQDKYEYRIKSYQDNLVRAYYAGAVQDTFGCSSSNTYDVVIQKIPHRLSDLVNISPDQSINIVYGSLKGFREIYRSIGLLLIKDSMIGINHQNFIKVWVNPRFQLNNIESQPLSYRSIPEHERQKLMVGNIFQLVNIRARKEPLWLQYCGEKQSIGVMGFEQAINFTQQFSSSTGIRLRNIGNRSDFDINETDKSVLSQSRMIRSRSAINKSSNLQRKYYMPHPVLPDIQRQKMSASMGDHNNLNVVLPHSQPPQYQNHTHNSAENPNSRPSFANLRTRAINNAHNNNPVANTQLHPKPIYIQPQVVPPQMRQLQPNLNKSANLSGSFHVRPHYQTHPISQMHNINPHSIPMQPPPILPHNRPNNLNNVAPNLFNSAHIHRSASLQNMYVPHNGIKTNEVNQINMSNQQNKNIMVGISIQGHKNESGSIGSQIKKIIDIPKNQIQKVDTILAQPTHPIKQNQIHRQLSNPQSAIRPQIMSAPSPQTVMIRQQINRIPSQKLIQSERLSRSREPGKIKHKIKSGMNDSSHGQSYPHLKINTAESQQIQHILYQQTPISAKIQNDIQIAQTKNIQNPVKKQTINIQRQQILNKQQQNTVANSSVKEQNEAVLEKPVIVIHEQKNPKINIKIGDAFKKLQTIEEPKQEDEKMQQNGGWATERYKNKYDILQQKLSSSVRGGSIVMAHESRMQSSKMSRASSSELKSSISYRDLRNLLKSVQRKQK